MDSGQQIEQWFFEFEKDITNFLVYYTGSKDVEDLVQETFLKALQAYDRYRSDSSPKTWLFTIARNTACDFYRKKSVWSKLKDKLLLQSIGPKTKILEENLVLQSEFQQLYEAINQLKPNYRDVVMLRGIAELSSEETAEILNWSVNKVNVTFFRAAKKLKIILGEGENDERNA